MKFLRILPTNLIEVLTIAPNIIQKLIDNDFSISDTENAKTENEYRS